MRAGTAANARWQVQYRLAVLDFSRGDYARATPTLESLVAANAKMPDWLKASALLYLAWTRDLAGRRADALTLLRAPSSMTTTTRPPPVRRVSVCSRRTKASYAVCLVCLRCLEEPSVQGA